MFNINFIYIILFYSHNIYYKLNFKYKYLLRLWKEIKETQIKNINLIKEDNYWNGL